VQKFILTFAFCILTYAFPFRDFVFEFYRGIWGCYAPIGLSRRWRGWRGFSRFLIHQSVIHNL